MIDTRISDVLICGILGIMVLNKRARNEIWMVMIIILGRKYWYSNGQNILIIAQHFVLGFLFGIIYMRIICKTIFEDNHVYFNPKLDCTLCAAVIIEELSWRTVVLGMVRTAFNINNPYLLSVCIILLSLLFVAFHKKATLEMCLYTCLLYYSSIFFPGANVGLHLGRNYFIKGCVYERKND